MEAESSAKRHRLSPPCWPSVCVVFHCFAGNPETDEFKFYIVNSNSDPDSSSGAGDGDEFRHKEPTIRFKLKGINPAATFCALKSTLYIFEGDNHHHQPATGNGGEGRFAGKFVIPNDILNGSGYLLQKEELVRINDMHEKKFSPKAIPTPDGNYILLFSSDIRWINGGFYDDSFELYDVKADSWKVLPRLPPPPRVVHLSPGIETYGFETESRFLIKNDIGIFVLDLDKGSWDQLSSESWLFDNPRGNFFGIDGFSFAPGYAYDISGSEFQYPPLTLFPEDDDEDDDDLVPMYLRHRRKIYPYATLLGRKDCVFDMGVVQAQWRTDSITNTENVRVILDMYRTNIDKLKIDMEKFKIESEKYNKDMLKYDAEGRRGEEPVFDGSLSNTADAIKTFKFMIDFDFFTYGMGQMYLFSI